MEGRGDKSPGGKVLILSDGKPGHRNQAIALARHLNLPFDAVDVHFRPRLFKAVSYVLDLFHLYSPGLFSLSSSRHEAYCALFAAGSESYYAAKTIARARHLPVVAVMLPKGYRYGDFDLIVAPEHDRPPRLPNIRAVPVNPCWVEPAGLVQLLPGERLVSLVIGGSNQVYDMDAAALREVIADILEKFQGYQIMAATSRRTSREVDEVLRTFPLTRCFLYTEDPANPIPDFLVLSEYVFLTADSTSMISEAVSFGSACVEVIPLKHRRSPGKFARFTSRLEELGCLHMFDGTLGEARRKLNLADYLEGIRLCG